MSKLVKNIHAELAHKAYIRDYLAYHWKKKAFL